MENRTKKYFNHKLLKKDKIEYRAYQEAIMGACANKNSLVVLPTGLGKTIIAILICIVRLHKYPGSQIIFLAPTKPLIQQHYQTFKELSNFNEDQMVLITGAISPEKRVNLYKTGQFFFITPQTLQNDIINSRIDLSNVSLIVFDEAHRAIGNYAYVLIAEKYITNAKFPQILAITASPGSIKEKILEIIENLHIKKIEVRTEDSPDVKPFIQPIELKWLRIDLPKEFNEIKNILETKLKECLLILKKNALINSINISSINRTDLIKLQKSLPRKIQEANENKQELFESLRTVAIAIRFSYMLELLETQGISSLSRYLDKLYEDSSKKDSSRTIRDLMSQPFMNKINQISKNLIKKGVEHPKIPILQDLLEKQFRKKPESRVIIFCHFRVTTKTLEKIFQDNPIIKAARFVGQQTKTGDKGLSQKDQIIILDNFKSGIYNTLIATSVAEEGLDIAECDMIIFYDTVPSAIRDIQRRGRTGRKKPGKVIILTAKNTRDESYYWVSYSKKKKMKSLLDDLIEISQKLDAQAKSHTQTSISDFIIKNKKKNNEKQDIKIQIIVDSRESSSSILKHLSKMGADIKIEKLDIGDYILSDKVAIERKTVNDLINSIIDSRLFKELKSLKSVYLKTFLVIEGEIIYEFSRIRKEALQGAIVSVMLDFYVPVIFTKSPEETAEWLYKLAKKEQIKGKKPLIRPDKTPLSYNIKRIQEFILAGFPDIDSKRAQDLLNYFGSLEEIFNAPIEALMNVKGIGKKIAKQIKEILKAKYF